MNFESQNLHSTNANSEQLRHITNIMQSCQAARPVFLIGGSA